MLNSNQYKPQRVDDGGYLPTWVHWLFRLYAVYFTFTILIVGGLLIDLLTATSHGLETITEGTFAVSFLTILLPLAIAIIALILSILYYSRCFSLQTLDTATGASVISAYSRYSSFAALPAADRWFTYR